jgi:ribosomal protein S18 acetylase RimI-like enzyme
MTTIRPATPDDAPAIAQVHVETWRSAYRGIVPAAHLAALSTRQRTDRWTEILRKPDQITFVAETPERGVVGFANGGPERETTDPRRAELYALYVLPDQHRRAIGRRLTAALARWLADTNFESLTVWVLEENPSRRFYERLGGTLAGRKEIEIAGRTLGEVAYEWTDVRSLAVQVLDDEFDGAVTDTLERNADLLRRLR